MCLFRSTKRPKVIEFCHVNEITKHIPVKATQPADATDTNAKEIKTTIESIKFIDQQRLELNRQLVALETLRCQLDTFGYHLNQTLVNLLQEDPKSDE